MNNSIIRCPKCKNYENLKVITPYDKEGYWVICEGCGFKKHLEDNEETKMFFHIHDIYVQCLSHRFCYGSLDLKDIKKFVMEKYFELNPKKFVKRDKIRMGRFKSKVKFTVKEIDKFLIWINEYIEHRGGMGNRIDAFNIKDDLEGKRKYLQSLSKKFRNEVQDE